MFGYLWWNRRQEHLHAGRCGQIAFGWFTCGQMRANRRFLKKRKKHAAKCGRMRPHLAFENTHAGKFLKFCPRFCTLAWTDAGIWRPRFRNLEAWIPNFVPKLRFLAHVGTRPLVTCSLTLKSWKDMTVNSEKSKTGFSFYINFSFLKAEKCNSALKNRQAP